MTVPQKEKKPKPFSDRKPLSIPYPKWKQIWLTCRGLFWSFWLIVSLLTCNALQTFSLLVWPFSKRFFRRINQAMAHFWWTFFITVVEKKNKIKVTFWGQDVPEKEHVILISNHQCMADIPTVMTLARRKQRIGDLKFFVKDIIKYVPGVGWGMLFLDCLFVKRTWSADRESISQTFRNISRYKVPIWLVSYLEGTRFTAKKLISSRKFAAKAGHWMPEHVLLPRTKGFVATVQGLRDCVSAIYDLTIGYPDGVPTLWQIISGFVPSLHIHISRTAIVDIPTDPAEISNWVMEQFKKKDQLMSFFSQHGVFHGEPIKIQ
ncbi:MAG: hypothetical protein CR997_12390 [Acidobacteria bacterium]|nr:MAG: hypothetical protein CR997_12390 [Acidobacteriota bacterium]